MRLNIKNFGGKKEHKPAKTTKTTEQVFSFRFVHAAG
jgi:hypothetical protein